MSRTERPGTAPVAVAAALALGSLLGSCRRSSELSEIALSVPYEVDQLDPHARNWVGSFAIASHFYEPLVTTDAEMGLVPALAARWTSPDPETWIFHIRPEVTFHSGRALTAQDVVYSIKRLLNDPSLDMVSYASEVKGVRASGPLTVEIRTRRPNGILLNSLRFILIVPDGSTRASLLAHVDGTGPYRLVAWRPGTEVVMARHEAYWGGEPVFSKVRFRLSRPPLQAADDIAQGLSQLAQCNTKELRGVDAKRFETVRQTSIFMKFLSYDFSPRLLDGRPNPFADQRVRKAVHLAVDRPGLVARLSTFGLPASQPVAPFIFGFNPELPEPRYDPEDARRLLSEAGYPEGFTTPLFVRRIFRETAEILRGMLEAVGVRAELRVVSDTEYFQRVAERSVPFLLSRFGCPTGDANLLFEQWIHTRDPARFLGLANDARFSSPELDLLIEESARIMETEPRQRALQGLLARVMENLVWVPLYIDEDVYVLDRRLKWRPRKDSYVLAAEVASGP